MKKTIAIGDVHGLTNWKKIVEAEENKGSRFVFMGDYIDPYSNISIHDLLSNILDIIALKQRLGDDVVLLLGNHDMHYLYEDFPKGTRYDYRIAELYQSLLQDRRELFQFAYQEGHTLFTHAGISNSWWKNDFLPHFNKENLPMKEGVTDIASMLNNAKGKQLEAMYQVSFIRGGDSRNGGIFWADMSETSFDPLKGFYQIVGHSRVPSIQTFSTDSETQITFCDSLFADEYYAIPSF